MRQKTAIAVGLDRLAVRRHDFAWVFGKVLVTITRAPAMGLFCASETVPWILPGETVCADSIEALPKRRVLIAVNRICIYPLFKKNN